MNWKSAFFVTILATMLMTGVAKADITSGLVGHWTFDDATGTSALDSIGGNNATLVYTQWDPSSQENNGLEACSDRDYCPTWATGKYGGGLSSIGEDITNVTGAGIQINNTNLYDLNDNFTVSMWFKTTQEQFESSNPSLYGMELMSNWIYGTFRGFDVSVFNYGSGSDTRISYRLDYDAVTACYGQGSIGPNNEMDGEWHNIAFMRDNGAIRLYVDGQLKFSNPCDGSDAPSPVIPNGTSDESLYIGWGSSSNYYAFNGSTDDVRIYDRPLSSADIEELYGYGKVYAYWNFNEGSGNTSYDSVNGYDLQNAVAGGLEQTWGRGYSGLGHTFNGTQYGGPNIPQDISSGVPICLETNGSISAWVNPQTCPNHLDGGCIIAGNTKSDGYMPFGIWYDSFSYAENVSCDVGDVEAPNAFIPKDAWTMVTCKWNTTGVYLYLNGTVVDTAPSQSSYCSGDSISVGGWSPGWAREFNGTVDNLRIGEAFSDEQISAYASEAYSPAPIVGNDIYACGGAITSSGTYTLQNNIDTSTGVVNDMCIEVEASDVDLNLNGKNIECFGYYTGAGIYYANIGTYTNLTVHDGTILNCAQTGIFGATHTYNNILMGVGALQFYNTDNWTSYNDLVNNSAYGLLINNCSYGDVTNGNFQLNSNEGIVIDSNSNYNLGCNNIVDAIVDNGIGNDVVSGSCAPTTTTTTTVGAISAVFTDIGGGVGELFTELGPSIVIFTILLGIGGMIGLALTGIFSKIGK